MKRTKKVYPVKDLPNIKEQILHWINQFSVCSFLDNHQYHSAHHSVECIAAAGEIEIIQGANTAQQIDAFYTTHQDWLFGHFSYEYNAKHLNKIQKKEPNQF